MTQIIPALDLIDGEVVRLVKGDYEQKKYINTIPWKNSKNTKKQERKNFIL